MNRADWLEQPISSQYQKKERSDTPSFVTSSVSSLSRREHHVYIFYLFRYLLVGWIDMLGLVKEQQQLFFMIKQFVYVYVLIFTSVHYNEHCA